MCEDDSIAALLSRVRSDDPQSEQEIWDRYFQRLVDRARSRLRQGSGSERDEEDVALSVFNSFFSRFRKGKADYVEDRTSLWVFLSWLMRNKLLDEYRRRDAKKRNMPRPGDLSDSEAVEAWHREIADSEPSTEQVVEFSEEFERLLALLPDKKRIVVERKLEGYTNEELANDLAFSERTIERWLYEIRKVWRSHLGLSANE